MCDRAILSSRHQGKGLRFVMTEEMRLKSYYVAFLALKTKQKKKGFFDVCLHAQELGHSRSCSQN